MLSLGKLKDIFVCHNVIVVAAYDLQLKKNNKYGTDRSA